MDIRFDQLMLSGGEQAAKQLGHERIWNAGLGAIAKLAIAKSGVPAESMSVDLVKQKLGVTDTHIELFKAGAGILQEILRKK